MFYRKKPVVIEAIQFKDDVETLEKISQFIDKEFSVDYTDPSNPTIKIPTHEGVMEAKVNDYIIKGIQGEFYPCKPDIFIETYEEVNLK